MKKIIALLTLLVSVGSYAGNYKAEFDESQEIKCHQELKTLGCVSGDEEDQSCAETKKAKLSKDCKSMHEMKKQN